MKSVLTILSFIVLATTANAADIGSGPLTENSPADYNIRFHPIPLLVGAASINMDFKIGSNWTVGPELTYWNISVTNTGNNAGKIDVNYSSAGLRANWFKNGTYTDGFYVGPFARYGSTKINTVGSSTVTGDASGTSVGSLFGYGWFWRSFNMMLGGGFAVASGQSTLVNADSAGNRTEIPNKGAGPAGEYSLGWTF
ncbi:MAG: hypothetical protein H7326_05615 [Bdellovibrionaceae bacterium]|nr:hypothetical protein [Pseudobdellovibrionaceae bacterium]